MRETPIDPRKIHGKYVPDKKNTDVDADVIDKPVERSWKKGVPPEQAEFYVPEKDPKVVDEMAIWLAVACLVGAALVSGIVPLAWMRYTVVAVGGFVALVFNMKNTHLQAKKFPVLGFNPLHLLTLAGCGWILWGGLGLLFYLVTFGRMGG